jgi:hypothetical protein
VTDDAGRAQDQGRRHRAKGQPSPATTALLVRYQQAMRDELAGVLDELHGAAPAPGLMLDGKPAGVVRPSLSDRAKLWDLAIRLGRELGTAIDVVPDAPAPTARRAPRRAPVDFG